MRTTRRVTREVDEVDDIRCNRCGASCRGTAGMNWCGLIGAEVIGGYDSPALGDMEALAFDVCERCLVEWVATFKHDPRSGDA